MQSETIQEATDVFIQRIVKTWSNKVDKNAGFSRNEIPKAPRGEVRYAH